MALIRLVANSVTYMPRWVLSEREMRALQRYLATSATIPLGNDGKDGDAGSGPDLIEVKVSWPVPGRIGGRNCPG